jgi:hypothetical protein
MRALPLQEFEVAATARIGIEAANPRTMLIDGAATFGWMEELASALEDRVFAMAQDAAIAFDHLGETLLGGVIFEVETLREARDIALRDNDVIVGAAIARTLRAVIKDW